MNWPEQWPQLDPPRRFGLVAVAVVVLDQLTKRLVADAGTLWHAGPVRIGTVYNREGVLGLPIHNGTLLLFGTLIVLLLAYLLTRSVRPEIRAGLWLLLAGAVSNTLDRFQYDGVLDITAIGPSAHFNLADLSIMAGAALLILFLWQRGQDA
jgi:lipoprotein signal peptidase